MLDELRKLAAANPAFRLIATMTDMAAGKAWDGKPGALMPECRAAI